MEQAGMPALEAIRTRRSTRRMERDLPPRECIEEVIEAGRLAPSGGNNQTTHLMVITDPAVLGELARIAERAFSGMEVREDTYPSLARAIEASKRGGYVFHYNAPVLIVAANRRGYGNAMADSACALENMMIAANALDLGSCWINQLHWLDGDAEIRACLEGLGLSKDEEITGGLILGYAAGGLPPRGAKQIHGNPVTWVEGPSGSGR